MQVRSLSFSRSKLCRNVSLGTVAPDLILVDDELRVSRGSAIEIYARRWSETYTLESDRSSRMRLSRAHSHLRPESVPEPVCEPRTRIHKYSGAVDPSAERLCVGVVLGDDAVGVVGGVVVDVGDGGGEGGDDLDGEVGFEELGVVVFCCCGSYEGREGGEGGSGRGGGEGC